MTEKNNDIYDFGIGGGFVWDAFEREFSLYVALGCVFVVFVVLYFSRISR